MPAIRPETPVDHAAIFALTQAAFARAEHTGHNEQHIVNALRDAGALTVSLVAVLDDTVIGHVAASPVTIAGVDAAWYGIGPVSVLPEHQGAGVGSALMRAVLQALYEQQAAGCVLLGDPAFYARFGFTVAQPLRLEGVPPEYFQAKELHGTRPAGVVRYHAAFDLPPGPPPTS